MRIKKTSETTPTMASIVDDYSTSTQDGYSCSFVNDAINYHTIERETGAKWIDGKKIYRIVILATSPSSTNTDTNIASIGAFNHLVSFNASIDINPYGIVPIPQAISTNNMVRMWIDGTTNGNIYMAIGNAAYINKEVTIVLEYTK